MANASTLYATCATAAGALVAIMGGFLISRVVGLLSQREALQMRHRELSGRVELATTEWHTSRAERLAGTIESFDRDRLKLIVEARGDVDVEAFANESSYRGTSPEEMHKLVEMRVEQVITAFNAIEAEVPSGPIPKDILREAAEDPTTGRLAVPAGQERIWYRVASELEHRRRAKSPYGLPLGIADLALTRTPDFVYQRQDQRIRDERDARSRLSALEAERGLIDDEIGRLASGVPRLMTSVGVLAYFALGSVALPVVLLTLHSTPSNNLARWGVTGAFSSGLALLVIFLFSTASSFRHKVP